MFFASVLEEHVAAGDGNLMIYSDWTHSDTSSITLTKISNSGPALLHQPAYGWMLETNLCTMPEEIATFLRISVFMACLNYPRIRINHIPWHVSTRSGLSWNWSMIWVSQKTKIKRISVESETGSSKNCLDITRPTKGCVDEIVQFTGCCPVCDWEAESNRF